MPPSTYSTEWQLLGNRSPMLITGWEGRLLACLAEHVFIPFMVQSSMHLGSTPYAGYPQELAGHRGHSYQRILRELEDWHDTSVWRAANDR